MGGVAASSLAYLSMNTVDRRMLWLYSCSGSDTTDLYTFEYSQGGDDWTPLEDGTMVWLPDPEEQQPCQVLDRGRNVYGGLSVSSDRNSELYFRWSRGESGLATLETVSLFPQFTTVHVLVLYTHRRVWSSVSTADLGYQG